MIEETEPLKQIKEKKKEVTSSNKIKIKTINAAVVVLGDLNRSPRMLNHAAAISKLVSNVNQISLIGFNGGDLRGDIINDPKIKAYYLAGNKLNNVLRKFPQWLFILSAIIKIFFQFLFLFYYLFTIPRPDFLILQNPPGIPALLICLILCFVRRTKLILDWHNYGYSILKVNKRNKLIVWLAYLYEKYLGRFATLSLCVSIAMKEDLKRFGIKNAIVLPDRAMPNIFDPNIRNNLNECFKIFTKYKDTFDVKELIEPVNKTNSESDKLKWKSCRPMLILSSTSWTPDEDFDVLLNALISTENKLKDSCLKGKLLNNLKEKLNYKDLENKVQLIITGRGPMKDSFMQKVDRADLKIIKIKSIWLESDDYPKVLSMVDLGVCLHYSSSGLDLPMKVVDMFSAGLPVLAIDYPTINELVIDGKNGLLFKNSDDLSNQIFSIFCEFTKNGESVNLNKMKDFINEEFSQLNWINQWENRLLRILNNK